MFPHPTRKTMLLGASYRRMPSGEDLNSAGLRYRGRFPFSVKWEGPPATASMLRITQASRPFCPEPPPLWTVTLRLPSRALARRLGTCESRHPATPAGAGPGPLGGGQQSAPPIQLLQVFPWHLLIPFLCHESLARGRKAMFPAPELPAVSWSPRQPGERCRLPRPLHTGFALSVLLPSEPPGTCVPWEVSLGHPQAALPSVNHS